MNGKINTGHKTTVSPSDVEPDLSHEPLATQKITRLDSPVHIHVKSRRKRLTDADGASAKAVIDGLVFAGILTDDSPKFVTKVSYSQEKIQKDEAEETIIYVYK